MIAYVRASQFIITIALIGLIMLQVRGSGLVETSSMSGLRTRRGFERVLFNLTIVFLVLFVLVGVASAYVSNIHA